MQQSVVHSSFDARDIKPFKVGVDYDLEDYADLGKIGIGGFTDKNISKMMDGIGMDSIQQLLTTASVAVPVQFLQNWLPGIVNYLTAARKIDMLIGVSTVGSWSDEQIVQTFVEMTGSAVPYTDYGNAPLSSWNPNYVQRTVVRFEQAMSVGILEEERSAAVRINSGDQKRKSAARNLEIARNQVGFYGYNSGLDNTYGFLNDPNLLAYLTVATGAASSSKLWANKTYLEIVNDIITALQQLRTQSQDTIDPGHTPITLAVATDCVEYLAKTTDFGAGISVRAWLQSAYPNIRIESAPQLNNANGGANVFYLYADSAADADSTDDGRTFIQVVPAKFQLLGIQKKVKGYEEDYANATAGVLVKRPFACTRWSGI